MITILMPVLRQAQAQTVLTDLNFSSIKPDLLHIFDQGIGFNPDGLLAYPCRIEHLGRNVGTNQVWNKMWSDQYRDQKYIGVIGDDYRVGYECLNAMYETLERNDDIHAVTCLIRQTKSFPDLHPYHQAKLKNCRSKGHMGFTLFDREFLINNIPPIPEVFNIFFGDDWIGWHLDKAGTVMRSINVPISHFHHEELGEVLNYKDVIEDERDIWKKYIRGEIQL